MPAMDSSHKLQHHQQALKGKMECLNHTINQSRYMAVAAKPASNGLPLALHEVYHRAGTQILSTQCFFSQQHLCEYMQHITSHRFKEALCSPQDALHGALRGSLQRSHDLLVLGALG